MNNQYREQYLWLQFIAALLQEDYWPSEIPKEQALTEVIENAEDPKIVKEARRQGLELDSKKLKEALRQGLELDSSKLQEFLDNLCKITDSLSRQPPEQLLGNLPPLEEIMAAYDEHLAEKRTKIEKTLFPSLEEQIEQIKAFYEDYRQSIQKHLIDTERLNPYLAREASYRITDKIITQIPLNKPLSRGEYQEILKSLRPAIAYELKRIGVTQPKIDQEPTIIISSLAEQTLGKAKPLAEVSHFTAPVEAVLATVELAPKKPPIPPTLAEDYPHLRWQPTGISVSPVSWVKAASKKVSLAPSATALRWLAYFAPDEIQKKYPHLLLATHGFTPKTAKGALEHTYPGSPEANFWQEVVSLFPEQESIFVRVFNNYYELNGLGKFASREPGPVHNLLAEVISFGKAKTFSGIKTAFWDFLKETKVGRFLSLQAGKLLARIGIKKAVGAAVKTAAKGLLAALPEPISKVLLGLSLVWGKIKGKIGGLFKRFGRFLTSVLPFKIKRATERGANTLENAFGRTLDKAGALFVGIATFPLPVSLFTVAIIGAIVGTISLTAFTVHNNQRAFVGVWRGAAEPVGSRYIQVEKTSYHSGGTDQEVANADLPIIVTYQITVTAKDSDLTDIEISDHIFLYQDQDGDGNGEERTIETLAWTIDELPQKETWTSPEYNLEATTAFQDSLLNNRVIVKAMVTTSGEKEESQTFSTLIIGTPPIPPNASLALKIVTAMNGKIEIEDETHACGGQVTLASWSLAKACLEGANLPNEAYILSIFEASVNNDYNEPYRGNLQCVSFAIAVSQGDLPPPENGNAQDYCSGNVPGYTLSTNWDGLRPGDYVVTSSGDAGHIAVVVSRTGDIVDVVEAMGNTGIVQLRNPSPGIIGIFQNPRFEYCGFLRRN